MPVPAKLPPGAEAELDAEEQARAESFRFREDRNAYVAAHVLFACAIRTATGRHRASWSLVRDATGKPHLSGFDEPLYASLSHSRGAVAVALSRRAELGIDIEARFDDFAGIAQDMLTVREQQAVLGSADPAHSFTRLWTRKEALAKAFGLGLRAPLAGIDVLDPCRLQLPLEMEGNVSLKDVACSVPYAMAVAARSVRLDVRSFATGTEFLIAEAGRIPEAA